MARRRDDDEFEEEQQEGSRLSRALGDASWRRAVLLPLILVLFGAGAWMTWKKYRTEVLGHHAYRLDPQNIDFTPPPDCFRKHATSKMKSSSMAVSNRSRSMKQA